MRNMLDGFNHPITKSTFYDQLSDLAANCVKWGAKEYPFTTVALAGVLTVEVTKKVFDLATSRFLPAPLTRVQALERFKAKMGISVLFGITTGFLMYQKVVAINPNAFNLSE